MTSAAPSLTDVLDAVGTLGPPGTPVTTPEVAEGFGCTQRTIYNRLEALVEEGPLLTKKVGANSRVWWRPVSSDFQGDGGASAPGVPVSLRDGLSPPFAVDGEMAERIREFDWAETPIGPMDEWPSDLRVAVDIMLGADEAIGIYWGEDLTLLYNDAARKQIGEKHPNALGRPAREVFPEAWETLGPMHEQVMAGEGAVRVEEQYLPLERGGAMEDVWFDSSFNPIPRADGSVGGVFNVSVDVTDRVQAESALRERKRESEDRYRTLFESIDEGFCIVEMLFDENDEPVDYRFLETNPAFEAQTGLSDVEGERMRALEPDHEEHWFEIYGRVAQTGEPERFTNRAEHLDDRWFDVYAFRIGDPEERKVALLFDNITERKEIEEDLRESEARLAAELETIKRLQEISTQSIGENDVDLLYESVLDTAMDLLDAEFGTVQRLDPQEHELDMVAYRGFSAEAIALWERVDAETSSSCGRALQTEERVIVSDVESCEFIEDGDDLEAFTRMGIRSMQSTPLVSRSGELLGMISTHWRDTYDPSERDLHLLDVIARQVADLMEQRAAYEALRESESRLSKVLAQLPLGVGVLNADGIFEMQNERMREILDGDLLPSRDPEKQKEWSAADADGNPLPPEQWPGARALRGEVVSPGIEFTLDRDGETRWFTVAGVPFEESGRKPKAIGVVQEITERKEMEEELRTSEKRLQVATNAAEIGVWEFDLQTDEGLYVSPEYAEILGYDESPADWDLDSALEHYHPEDRERLLAYLDDGLGERTFESRIIRTDGEERWISVESDLYMDSDGDPVRAIGTIQDVTEHKRREQHNQFLLDLSDTIRGLTDEEEIEEVCTRLLAEQLGLDRAYFARFFPSREEALVEHEYRSSGIDPVGGLYPYSSFPDVIRQVQTETLVYDDIANASTIPEAERQALLELDFGAWIGARIGKDDQETDWLLGVTFNEPHDWTEAEVSLIEDVADRIWTAVERARAEQSLKASNDSLERLNDVNRLLIDADSETIRNRVPEHTVDILGVEYAALWRYDDETGDIELDSDHAASGTEFDAVHLSAVSREQVWKTFIGNEIDIEDSLDIADSEVWPARLGSRALVPLGRHGVIVAASADTETFDDRLVDLVRMAASSIETAWNRAESEAALASQNEELQRLDRLNRLIRRIDQALVGAETVEGLYEDVCERLANSSLYEFAWIGTHDAVTDTVTPRAWAGVDSEYIERVASATDSSEPPNPVGTALRGGTLQVVSDVATDPAFAPWREATLERGARSLVSISLVYDDAQYGVLTVYADRPNPEGRDLEVLEELGRTIGHAINARETVVTRQTDLVVELTLRFTEARTPLSRLARQADCRLAFEGFVPRTNGETDVFFTVESAATAAVRSASDQILSIVDLDCLNERPGTSLFRARVNEEGLVVRLVEGGAVVHDLTFEAGDVTAVVDLEESAEVRAFVDDLRAQYPVVELLARQPRERQLKTRQTFVDIVQDRLTARQLEMLETAYLSGYFETPRTTTGQEIIQFLGISQPTFSQHLRAAERSVFGLLFSER